jgi:hypothetical protein
MTHPRRSSRSSDGESPGDERGQADEAQHAAIVNGTPSSARHHKSRQSSILIPAASRLDTRRDFSPPASTWRGAADRAAIDRPAVNQNRAQPLAATELRCRQRRRRVRGCAP